VTSGTKEWADSNVNVLLGCRNDCRYCYAKRMAVRFGRATESTWREMRVNWRAVERGYGKRKGRVMFPTSHDLFPEPEYLEPCLEVLRKLLWAGNQVLVTTKPRLPVVREICRRFAGFRGQLQFRFTIGSVEPRTLAFWEPGAPPLAERLDALRLACSSGFRTSVSAEPLLDDDPRLLIDTVERWVTESIWLGRMNYIPRRSPAGCEVEYARLRRISSGEHWDALREAVKHPLVRWKH